MKQLRLLFLGLIPLACPFATSAQTVHVVDSAGGAGSAFVQIQDAVNAASAGDIILVRSGTYDPVSIQAKSLTLVADSGAFVDILPGFLSSGTHLQITDLAPGQTVRVRGWRLRMSAFAVNPSSIRLDNNAGTVWLEDIHVAPTFLVGNSLESALIATSCAGVHVSRCTLAASVAGFSSQPAPPGIHATSSNLSLHETTVVGASGAHASNVSLAQEGGDGVFLSGGTLFASGSSFRGGPGGSPRLTQDGADGGDGLVLVGGAIVRLLDTTLEGGDGTNGNGPGTTPGSQGAPSTVIAGSLTALPGRARGFETASPVRGGQLMTETFTGENGDVVVLMLSVPGPFPGIYLPFANGTLAIAPPFVSVLKGTIGASGQLVVQPLLPPLPAGFDGIPIALQGVMLSTGGGIYLTGPSALTCIDASL